MIDQRTQFLIQILDKIGGPLTAAVAAGPHIESESDSAQRVAELLNRSVQLGLSVAQQMNVRDAGQADGVHLSLAAFSGPLMAGQYIVSGKVPSESDIKKLTTSLQAVLTFADNFTPAIDSTQRLQKSDAVSHLNDDALIYAQTLNAFAPVIQVVSEYAFGKPEGKLILDIASRLMDQVTPLREHLFGPDLSDELRHQADIILMKTLCGLYAAIHGGETRRLMALPDQARSSITVSMDPVWEGFDRQLAMVKLIAEQLVPDGKPAGQSGKTVKPTAPPPEPPQQSPVSQSNPANNPPNNPPNNPMAFFAPGAKKEKEAGSAK